MRDASIKKMAEKITLETNTATVKSFLEISALQYYQRKN